MIWCRQGWYPISYGFCPSIEAWNRQMKIWKVKGESDYPKGGSARTHTFQPPGNFNIVILVTCSEELDHTSDPVGTVALLAHEAVHVWQIMSRDCQDTDHSDETEAYAIQKIFTELMEAFSYSRVVK